MVDNSLFNLMGKMLKYVGGWEHLWERDFAYLDQRCAGYWEYFTKLISSLFKDSFPVSAAKPVNVSTTFSKI